MSQYLDKIHEAQQDIRIAKDMLYTLADAFDLTGNRDMSGKLCRIAFSIDKAQGNIGDAVSTELHRSVKQAEESAAATVQAVLNASLMRDKDDNDS